MNPRTLLLLLLPLVIPVVRSTAQETPDSKRAELTVLVRLKTMTPAELQTLMDKAKAGDAESQFWVGHAYSDGRLVQKDGEEALQWFLKSAEQGYAPAQRLYGMASVHINPAVGERWMLRAAEQGDAEAEFWLGVAYEQNWFGTTDAKEAVKWYQKAAQNGNPDAQVELGQRYKDGEGVEQNFILAAEWFRKAAEHVPDLGGAGQGRYRLGLLYVEGHGVPRDYAQAYFWFSLSGLGNADDAKAHLSAQRIKATDELVNEWKERHRVNPEVAAALHIEN
jgi:TPR repeat protein